MSAQQGREDYSTPNGGKPKRYPDYLMPFAGAAEERYQRFAELREDLLADYCYNTARAYWADLQDWFEWAVERDKDVLALTRKDQTQYYALLRRRKYSESTIRRRRTAYRLVMAREACPTVESSGGRRHRPVTGASAQPESSGRTRQGSHR